MATSIVYTDQGPTTDGAALAADHLNTAVVAQAYLLWGGVMATSAAGSASTHVPGLDLPMPETAAVVIVPNALDATQPPQAIYVRVPTTSVPCTFSSDNYVDLYATENGPASTGSYFVFAVGIGAQQPPQDPGTLRLCKVTMGGSGITSVTQLATPCPVSQPMVEADLIEAATWDTLGATSTLLNNLDRIRYQLGAIYARVPGGGEWITAGTLESWDRSQPGVLQPMVPWSTRGLAGGVAELDQNGRLPVGELPFGAVFTEPSLLSNGTFVDPCPSQTLALKVSGGECVDALTAGTATITALAAGSISTSPGGTISGDHIVGNVDVNTPTLYVDAIFPHTAGSSCSRTINVHGAILNVVDCQIQGPALAITGHAQLGSAGIDTALTVGTSLGVSGVAVFGSTGNSPGVLAYGPLTVDDGTAGNPASVTVGGNRYTDVHADLMVAGDAIVQGNAYVRTTFHVASSSMLSDVTCASLAVTGVISGPITLDGDLTLQPAGALGSGSLRLRRLIYDQGDAPPDPSGYQAIYAAGGASLHSTDRVANKDNYGYLDYATGSTTADGDQFSVVYGSSDHAAHPGVFIMMSTQGGKHVPTPVDIGHVFISSSTNTGFTVGFSNAPPTGVTYRFIYHVVE